MATEYHHRRTALQLLESLRAAGVQQLPRASQAAVGESGMASTLARAPQPPAQAASGRAESLFPQESDMGKKRPAESLATAVADEKQVVSQAASLRLLQQEVTGCTLCRELAETRTQTVFGVGNPQAKLCFLGEAPGADEDRLGEPFVGRAGKLLDKIIEACTLQREEVYILNNLKCRPPGNRNPKPEESLNCSRYLIRQLELIQPEYICCLGAIAAQNLLDTQTPIGKLRGKVHTYRGINVVCTYHPAYLLRNPAAKKDTWEDMKMLMGLMGVEL